MVALEVGGLTAVPYLQQKLERKKSKVVGRSHGSSNYLDVSQLPHMTRNVSETQLLALKSVGMFSFLCFIFMSILNKINL